MSDNGHGMVPLSTHSAPDGYQQAQGCKMDCENCELRKKYNSVFFSVGRNRKTIQFDSLKGRKNCENYYVI